MMGSVAQKVARHSPVPVLIVRENGHIPSGPYPDPPRTVALGQCDRAHLGCNQTAALYCTITPDLSTMHFNDVFAN